MVMKQLDEGKDEMGDRIWIGGWLLMSLTESSF